MPTELLESANPTTTAGRAIRCVTLPLPFAPGSVNAYLVPLDHGWMLVDCGLDRPETLRAFDDHVVPWTDIRCILLTHAHPDHSGSAARLRARTGAPVWMHRAEDAVLADLAEPTTWLARQNQVLRRAGVPEDLRTRIESSTAAIRSTFPRLRADRWLANGYVVPTAVGPMEILRTPGHSPGHLCLYFPGERLLLAGDQLLDSRKPFLEWHPEWHALSGYRRSLERLAMLDIDWVLPAHGPAFRDHRARIAALLDKCRRREAALRHFQESGATSPQDLALALWARPLSPLEHRNAVYEVLAYLPPAS